MTEPDYASAQEIEKERQKLVEFSKTFPFFQLLGLELLEIEPGRAKISVAWHNDLCQPAGIMHGGVIASLVDTTIAHSILLTPQHLKSKALGGQLVSLDLRIKYLRPVSSGLVYCEGRVTRLGRQIIHAVATVTNPAGKEVATGDSIYMAVSRGQLRPKDT